MTGLSLILVLFLAWCLVGGILVVAASRHSSGYSQTHQSSQDEDCQ